MRMSRQVWLLTLVGGLQHTVVFGQSVLLPGPPFAEHAANLERLNVLISEAKQLLERLAMPEMGVVPDKRAVELMQGLFIAGSRLAAEGAAAEERKTGLLALEVHLQLSRRVLGEEHPDTLAFIDKMASQLYNQGQLDAAEPYVRELLEKHRRISGREHTDTLETIDDMGILLRAQGRLADAEPYFRETLEIRRRLLGDEDPITIDSIFRLGEVLKLQDKLADAEWHFREALEKSRRVRGQEALSTIYSLVNLGDVLKRQSRPADAEVYFREALDVSRRVLGEDSLSAIASNVNIGLVLQAQGRLTEAEGYLREAVEKSRLARGADDTTTVKSMGYLGVLLRRQNKFKDAEPYLREAVEKSRRVLDEEDASRINFTITLGDVLKCQGNFAGAEPYLREALSGIRRTNGAEDPTTLSAVALLGIVLHAQGGPVKLVEAEQLFRETLRSSRRMRGEDDPDTIFLIVHLGVMLYSQGRLAEAEPLVREALERQCRILGEDHPDTISSLGNFGALLSGQGRWAEAEQYFRDALQKMRSTPGMMDKSRANIIDNFGCLLLRQGNFGEAEILCREALTVFRSSDDDSVAMLTSMNNYATVLQALGRSAEAEPYFREIIERTRRLLGENDLTMPLCLNNYASVLVALRRAAEAESYLRSAVEGSCRVLGQDHPNAIACIQNLGSLLSILGRSAEAEPYSREAMEKSRRVLGEDHPDTLDSEENFVSVSFALGHVSGVGEVASSLVEHRNRLYLDQSVHLDRSRQLMLFADQFGNLSNSINLGVSGSLLAVSLSGSPEVIEPWSRAALGESWCKTLAGESRRTRHLTQLASASADEGVRERLTRLTEAKLRLANGFWSARPDSAEKLAEDRALIDQLERELSSMSRPYELLTRERGVWIDDVARALGPAQATVDYVTFTPLVRVPAERRKESDDRVFEFGAERHYAAVVLRCSGKGADGGGEGNPVIDVVDLGPAGPIEKAVGQFRASIESYVDLAKRGVLARGNSAARAAALSEDESSPGEMSETRAALPLRELHRLIWAPLAKQLDGASRVYVSPDGALHEVPLESLVTGRDADGTWRYLVESGPELVYESTGREAGRFPVREEFARGEQLKPGPSVLIGAPDFDASPDQLAAARGALVSSGWPGHGATIAQATSIDERGGMLEGWSRTVLTLGESDDRSWSDVDSLSSLIGAAQTALEGAGEPVAPPLLGAQAQESVVLGLDGLPGLGRPRVLQLATHGQFVGADAAERPGVAENERRALRDPMMRSALVMAGRNVAGQGDASNDLLTALEVTTLDLRGTELVVLTACHSGQGDAVRGEGVSGLASAFLVAGASSVVASRWEVLSNHTIAQMREFYDSPWLRAPTGQDESGSGMFAAFRSSQLAALTRARTLATASDEQVALWIAAAEAKPAVSIGQAKLERERGLHASAHPVLWAAFSFHGSPGTSNNNGRKQD